MSSSHTRQRDGEAAYRRLLDIILRDGWAVVGVVPGPGDPDPTFSYSVGLADIGHPEIIVFGLKPEIAKTIINQIGTRFRSYKTTAEPGVLNDQVANLPCMFVVVPDDGKTNYMYAAVRHHGGTGFPALQLVWPDRAGKFPWDADFERKFSRVQPVLGDRSRREQSGGH